MKAQNGLAGIVLGIIGATAPINPTIANLEVGVNEAYARSPVASAGAAKKQPDAQFWEAYKRLEPEKAEAYSKKKQSGKVLAMLSQPLDILDDYDLTKLGQVEARKVSHAFHEQGLALMRTKRLEESYTALTNAYQLDPSQETIVALAGVSYRTDRHTQVVELVKEYRERGFTKRLKVLNKLEHQAREAGGLAIR
jgi:hypothetical protein